MHDLRQQRLIGLHDHSRSDAGLLAGGAGCPVQAADASGDRAGARQATGPSHGQGTQAGSPAPFPPAGDVADRRAGSVTAGGCAGDDGVAVGSGKSPHSRGLRDRGCGSAPAIRCPHAQEPAGKVDGDGLRRDGNGKARRARTELQFRRGSDLRLCLA